MKRKEMNVLAETINSPVIQFPGRQFPGVLIQGDSLFILHGLTKEIEDLSVGHKNTELNAAIAMLKEKLSDFVQEYEAARKAHNMQLPYSSR